MHPPCGAVRDPILELCSILFHGSDLRVEPDAYWSETGRPVTNSIALRDTEVLRLADHLARHGFFAKASREFPRLADLHLRLTWTNRKAGGSEPLAFHEVVAWKPSMVNRLEDLRVGVPGSSGRPSAAFLSSLRVHFGIPRPEITDPEGPISPSSGGVYRKANRTDR